MRNNELIFNLIYVPLDFALMMVAAFAAYFLRVSPVLRDIRPVIFELPLKEYTFISLGVSALLLLLLALSGLYVVRSDTSIRKELSGIAIAISGGMALVIVFMFFNRAWFDSRFILLAGWIFAIILVSLGRLFMRYLRTRKNIGRESILVLGDNSKAHQVEEEISQNKKLNFKLAAPPVSPDVNMVKTTHQTRRLDRVLVTDENLPRDQMMSIVNYCEENGIRFSYLPDMFGSMVADMHFDMLESFPVVSVRPSPLDGWGRVFKRIMDIAGSAFALIVLSPVFLMVAFLIKWESKGPVFVRLKRISNGKELYVFKFRSMIKDAHKYKEFFKAFNERQDGPLFKMENDPRVTKVGAFLRSRRIDEIPQFINVLKGDLSLVGPRPHEPEEIEQYEKHHKKILAIKSGVTGMAQVNGAHTLPFEEEVKLDRYYIEHWSLKLDVIIILKTVKLLLTEKSAV